MLVPKLIMAMQTLILVDEVRAYGQELRWKESAGASSLVH